MTTRKLFWQSAALLGGILLAVLPTTVQATEDFCAVVLKTPDGFLALREGPGMRFAVRTKLKRGDLLLVDTAQCMSENVCDDARQWLHVNAVQEGATRKPQEGWVSRQYVQDFLCPE